MAIDAVILQVERAFPEAPLPETTLRQAQLADQSMSREISQSEWDAAGTLDRGVRWKDIPDDTLIECDAALSHQSEEGFVYYVPAYMRLALRHLACPAKRSDEAFGFTVFHLTHRTNYSLGRYKHLSDAQIDAVISFLREVRDAGSFEGDLAEKALTRYWETPEARRRTIIHVP